MSEKLIESAQKNIERGRAIATGVGVFAGIFYQGKILLRRRIEKGSLISHEDMSGKWELPGGGVDISDFDNSCIPYQSAVIKALDKELREEVCLGYQRSDQIVMIPAWLKKEGIIDLAFVVPLEFVNLELVDGGDYFSIFDEGILTKKIAFFSKEDIAGIEIISERMKFLIMEVFRYQEEKGF
ncbi:MAG: hypothetical protein PHW52_00960 [Candidatus Pacebacteria bacterium]|nr:hypothetical protein [Candidatus Paceibacterota bacterium]